MAHKTGCIFLAKKQLSHFIHTAETHTHTGRRGELSLSRQSLQLQLLTYLAKLSPHAIKTSNWILFQLTKLFAQREREREKNKTKIENKTRYQIHKLCTLSETEKRTVFDPKTPYNSLETVSWVSPDTLNEHPRTFSKYLTIPNNTCFTGYIQ